MIDDQNYTESVKSMRNRTKCLEHEGDYWTDQERESLIKKFHEGMGITQIAITLQRTEPAVIQKIEKLDLYDRKGNPARAKNRCKQTKCSCKECLVDKENCPHHILLKDR